MAGQALNGGVDGGAISVGAPSIASLIAGHEVHERLMSVLSNGANRSLSLRSLHRKKSKKRPRVLVEGLHGLAVPGVR